MYVEYVRIHLIHDPTEASLVAPKHPGEVREIVYMHSFYLDFLVGLRHQQVHLVVLASFASQNLKIFLRQADRVKFVYVMENFQDFAVC